MINKNKIKSGFYNAGFENTSILDIAKLVSENMEQRLMFHPIIMIQDLRLDS